MAYFNLVRSVPFCAFLIINFDCGSSSGDETKQFLVNATRIYEKAKKLESRFEKTVEEFRHLEEEINVEGVLIRDLNIISEYMEESLDKFELQQQNVQKNVKNVPVKNGPPEVNFNLLVRVKHVLNSLVKFDINKFIKTRNWITYNLQYYQEKQVELLEELVMDHKILIDLLKSLPNNNDNNNNKLQITTKTDDLLKSSRKIMNKMMKEQGIITERVKKYLMFKDQLEVDIHGFVEKIHFIALYDGSSDNLDLSLEEMKDVSHKIDLLKKINSEFEQSRKKESAIKSHEEL